MACGPTFTRRDLGLAALALGATALPSVASAQAQPQPNIVFILVDNVGWGDFGCYGGMTPTPRIDKFANEGIRFNSYYVEAQVRRVGRPS